MKVAQPAAYAKAAHMTAASTWTVRSGTMLLDHAIDATAQ